ncbi:MAG: hypothetical protein ILO53_03350 [Clostridia bacterium]|nr:hypothetical protein [Clostridia bacterium]
MSAKRAPGKVRQAPEKAKQAPGKHGQARASTGKVRQAPEKAKQAPSKHRASAKEAQGRSHAGADQTPSKTANAPAFTPALAESEIIDRKGFLCYPFTQEDAPSAVFSAGQLRLSIYISLLCL